MQRFVAVLAFTLAAGMPAFAAVVTAEQRMPSSAPAGIPPVPDAVAPLPPQATPPPAMPGTLQTPAPTMTAPVAPYAPAAAPATPRPPSLPNGALAVNIKVDLVLTDNFGGTPTKKTVSMVVMNRQSGMIRTQNVVAGHPVRLDVDAAVEQHATGGTTVAPTGGGPLTLRLTLQYTPAPPEAAAAAGRGIYTGSSPAGLNESLAVILQDGKPLLISQSADPASDRRVTVEVTATVLK